MYRPTPHKLTTLRWLQFCVLLVVAVIGHDVLMAATGQHVAVVAPESTCGQETRGEQHRRHGHGAKGHRHHVPVLAVVDHASDEPSIACDEARVVAPVKRLVDDGATGAVAILPLRPQALEPATVAIPDTPDWLARDPHARRALWQVYRI